MPLKKMEAKVVALESEVVSPHGVLVTMQSKAEEDQKNLFTMLEQRLTMSNSGVSMVKSPQETIVVEFHQFLKKVELPMFNGDDPVGWITRTEIYFQIHEMSSEIRVNLAQLCMEGSMIHFFKSLMDNETLKGKLLEWYGGIGEGDFYKQLVSLQQVGGVDECIQEFERLIAQVPYLPKDQYFGYFIHGLKEGTRGRVHSMRMLGTLSHSRLLNLMRVMERGFLENDGALLVHRNAGY